LSNVSLHARIFGYAATPFAGIFRGITSGPVSKFTSAPQVISGLLPSGSSMLSYYLCGHGQKVEKDQTGKTRPANIQT
jgi:hypothetical protein